MEHVKINLTLNRPTYAGFVLLELSKLLMYDLYCNYIKRIFGDKSHQLFTDTDLLTYEIETPIIYDDMAALPNHFDFSDYPRNHPIYILNLIKIKVIGMFKDELNSDVAIEFVGLRAKMYSLLTTTEEKRRAKGVSTHVVRKKLTHNYKDILFNITSSIEEQIRIGQDSQNLYTYKQNKSTLSPFYDKRHILSDGITSLAYGHFQIPFIRITLASLFDL